MKYFFILFSSFIFSQTIENVSIKYDVIYYKININKVENYNELLSKNPKLEIFENRGIGKNIKCNCKEGAFFINEEMNFEFTINDNFIEVFNIRFKNSIQINIGAASTSNSENSLEFYAIKNNGELKKNKQFIKNYKCLEDYFLKTFIF